jgi:hypothetical protein
MKIIRNKMMLKKIFRRLAVLGVVTLAAVALSGLGWVTQAATGDGLKISPVKDELKLKPGEIYKGELKVQNLKSEKVTVGLETQNFTAGGDGVPEFNNETGGTYTLKSWLKLTSEEVILNPGEEKSVPFRIEVPGNAEAGGHYGAILAYDKILTDGKTDSSIGVQGKLAYLLLVTVEGDMKVGGKLKEFSTDKKSYGVPEVKFTTNYENTGNVHVKPIGSITISNWSGEKIGEIEMNKDGGNVLPKETRGFSAEWKESGTKFGKFKAELKLSTQSPDGQAIQETATVYFWILPWKLILLIVLVIVVVVVLAALALKGYKESVLKRTGKKK